MSTDANRSDFLSAAAALSAAMGVGLGAYGAHGLTVEQSLVDIWRTGVAYQMWHALGAFACAWLATRRSGRTARVARAAGWMLLAGSVAFAVSLYVFVLDGTVPVTGLAPAGGMVMIAGWLLLAYAAIRRGTAIF
jgi:uncharacterized membrane protein YgdD (TMEM256/DUF423 family)